jgi:hypothetical protein
MFFVLALFPSCKNNVGHRQSCIVSPITCCYRSEKKDVATHPPLDNLLQLHRFEDLQLEYFVVTYCLLYYLLSCFCLLVVLLFCLSCFRFDCCATTAATAFI